MLKIFRGCLLLGCIILTSLLAGCFNQQTPVEKIYEVFEKVVVAEKLFEEQQDPLVKLEKEEQVIYDKIISLGLKETEEISTLTTEALDIVKQRKEHMEKEQQSLDESKSEFVSIKLLLEEMDESAQKKKAKELYDLMMERYRVHKELSDDYLAALELDKELYEMFKEDDIQLEKLQDQIVKINEKYSEILTANQEFNEKTKQYNETKISFYKESGMDIKINDEKN